MSRLNKLIKILLYTMKQQVKISKLKGNPSNPRNIKNDKIKSTSGDKRCS